jgi:beta-1,2-mannobiose phosphorylase / 1,2-beta-oligomannan phosphorylase
VIQRNPANPIIKPEDTQPSHDRYRVRGTFNPGAVKFGDEIILLLRVAED